MSRYKYCNSVGHVPLENKNHNSVIFACVCTEEHDQDSYQTSGTQMVRRYGLMRWNGLEYQTYKNEQYRLIFNDIIGGNNSTYMQPWQTQ